MSYLSDHFPSVDCTESGEVFRDGKLLHQFKSNGYRQVIVFDASGKSRTCGVHCLVAMKYLDYFEGCIVHHKDHDRSNINLSNLEIF